MEKKKGLKVDFSDSIAACGIKVDICKQLNEPFSSPASVRLLTFSNDFSSEAAEPILLKFNMERP